MNPIIKEISRVLKALTGKMDGYYLAGGTALSLFYFQHRESYDLDFFSKEFSKKRIEDIVKNLSADIDKKLSLIGEETKKDRAQVLVYSYKVNEDTLKIDFVEDAYKLIKPPKIINGIPALEKEDIYLRRILRSCAN